MSDQKLDEISGKYIVDNGDLKDDNPGDKDIPGHKMPSNIPEQIRQCEFENLFDENFKDDFRFCGNVSNNEPNADNIKNAFPVSSDIPEDSFIQPGHKMLSSHEIKMKNLNDTQQFDLGRLYLSSNIAEQIRQRAMEGAESENIPDNGPDADKNIISGPSDMPEHSFHKIEHKMVYLPSNIAEQIRHRPLEGCEKSPNEGEKSYAEEKREKIDSNISVSPKQKRELPNCQDMEEPVDISSNLGEIVIHTNNTDSEENIKQNDKAQIWVNALYYCQVVFSVFVILVLLVAMIGLIKLFCQGNKKVYTPRQKNRPSMSKEDYEIWIKHNVTVARNRFPWNPYLWLPKVPYWN